ncbi:DNA polymerase III subunit beta [Candidatus Falkowbacteria bacterium]|nr:DNA polymerase III subunit beta [Candidatus Falkowbacteria bacterium]
MNIIILQKNLKQGVFATSYITGKNNNLPILNNVLLQAKDGTIKLISTDLEMGITSTVRGKIETEGSLTVNAKILSNYINLLPNKKIDLKVEGTVLNIIADNYKSKINCEGSDDYPLIPEIGQSEVYTVKINDFKEVVSAVAFAVSSDDSRPALAGVLLIVGENNLTLVGTDSYRLAEKRLNLASGKPSEERRVIIPLKTLQELVRIIGGDYTDNKDDDELRIILNDNQIMFSFDSVEIVSRLIDERYPDYKQIIPNTHKTTCVTSKEELIRAVKTSAIFSKNGINDVILDYKAEVGELLVSAVSGQTGENVTNISAKIEGVDNSITINYRYLLDGLNNIKTDLVKMELIDANTPFLLKQAEGDDYLYIIMPIKR